MSKRNVVVIGVSTGGPPTLAELFGALPPLKAAFVIVQHVAVGMDGHLVRGLAAAASMPVQLAQDGAFIWHGEIHVARAGTHLELEKNQQVRLCQGPKVNYVQPSVDVTMKSLERQCFGGKIVGIILTGMGKDGAQGIRHVKEIGGVTMAQDQQSSIIYGMPKAAAETGAVDYVLSPKLMAAKLMELLEPVESYLVRPCPLPAEAPQLLAESSSLP